MVHLARLRDGSDEFRHRICLYLTAKIIIVSVRQTQLALSPFSIRRTNTQDGVPFIERPIIPIGEVRKAEKWSRAVPERVAAHRKNSSQAYLPLGSPVYQGVVSWGEISTFFFK